MKILIDNGHGIQTKGKRSPDGKLLEYAHTRDLARQIVNILKSRGYDSELLVPEDDDIFQVTIEELQTRRGRLLVELEKCENTLSNSDNEVSEIIATCCHLSTLWNDSDLETKIKVQQLVFPNGIFWNHENCIYRTPEKSPIFNIIDRISMDYIQRTEVDFTTSVPLCRPFS